MRFVSAVIALLLVGQTASTKPLSDVAAKSVSEKIKALKTSTTKMQRMATVKKKMKRVFSVMQNRGHRRLDGHGGDEAQCHWDGSTCELNPAFLDTNLPETGPVTDVIREEQVCRSQETESDCNEYPCVFHSDDMTCESSGDAFDALGQVFEKDLLDIFEKDCGIMGAMAAHSMKCSMHSADECPSPDCSVESHYHLNDESGRCEFESECGPAEEEEDMDNMGDMCADLDAETAAKGCMTENPPTAEMQAEMASNPETAVMVYYGHCIMKDCPMGYMMWVEGMEMATCSPITGSAVCEGITGCNWDFYGAQCHVQHSLLVPDTCPLKDMLMGGMSGCEGDGPTTCTCEWHQDDQYCDDAGQIQSGECHDDDNDMSEDEMIEALARAGNKDALLLINVMMADGTCSYQDESSCSEARSEFMEIDDKHEGECVKIPKSMAEHLNAVPCHKMEN